MKKDSIYWRPDPSRPGGGGFMRASIHGEAACEGLVKVGAQAYERLLAGQAEGRAIVTGPTGSPMLVDQADVPVDEETRLARRRAERDRRLRASDWTQAMDTLLGNPALKAAWALYRQALRDLDMTGTDWPAEPAAESFPVPKIEGGQP